MRIFSLVHDWSPEESLAKTVERDILVDSSTSTLCAMYICPQYRAYDSPSEKTEE
jgi:hypothetical protein